MEVGSRYLSYEEFEKALNDYTKLVNHKYWIRDARTISNQRRRFPDTVKCVNESLKYYHIRLACVKGGRRFESKNIKFNRNSSTKKQECKASIFVRLSQCQQYLTVLEFDDKHNHRSLKASNAQQRFTVKQNTLMKLTKHRKLKVIEEQCKLLSDLCMECPTEVFYHRVHFIKKLIQVWTEESVDAVSDDEYSKTVKLQTIPNINKLTSKFGNKADEIVDDDIRKIKKEFLNEDNLESLTIGESDIEIKEEYLETEYLEEEYLQEVFDT